jgi:hypothetical protein
MMGTLAIALQVHVGDDESTLLFLDFVLFFVFCFVFVVIDICLVLVSLPI